MMREGNIVRGRHARLLVVLDELRILGGCVHRMSRDMER